MQCSVGGDFYHHRAAVPAASVFASAECAINDGLCRLVRDCCCHRPDFFSYGCGEEAPRSGVFGMVGCRSLYHSPLLILVLREIGAILSMVMLLAYCLILLFKRGTIGPNEYGPDPLAGEDEPVPVPEDPVHEEDKM